MKANMFALLILTGCAAQPVTYSPPAPSQVDEHAECVNHIARVLAFAKVAGPVLDKCLAGNAPQCATFAVFLEKVRPQDDSSAASLCFESGQNFGGMAYEVNRVLPPMTKKIIRYNKLMDTQK